MRTTGRQERELHPGLPTSILGSSSRTCATCRRTKHRCSIDLSDTVLHGTIYIQQLTFTSVLPRARTSRASSVYVAGLAIHSELKAAVHGLGGAIWVQDPCRPAFEDLLRTMLPCSYNNNMSDAIFYGFLALIPLGLFYAQSIGRREFGLPPGPPTLPILGNIHQFPKNHPHLKFMEWGREYGGIFSLKVSSRTVIVISDRRIARDLLESKGASTSSRPPSHFGKLVTGMRSIVFMPYSQDLRRVQRLVHNMLSKDACNNHLPIQSAEATQLMYDFLKQPDQFYDHVNRYTSSVITSVLAGVRSPRITSPIVVAFIDYVHKWAGLMEPAAHPPVDVFPILKYVPERWASWKTIVRDVRAGQRRLYFSLIGSCERRVAADQRNGSFLEDVVANLEKYGIDRETAACTCGVLMEGGTETTATYLHHFMLLMVNHPEIQSKAQREVDGIVGEDRTPTLDDFESLPYVQAVMSEVFRMRPPLQLGVPHYSIADEVVDNYLIPKNSTIFTNIWAMNHDPEAFDQPERFDPDRFLIPELRRKAGMKDTADDSDWDLPFGYGRRFCVGIHLAKSSLKLNVMNFLWAFDFRHAIDPVSKEKIAADVNGYMQGATLAALPFICDIQPRSTARAQIIEQSFIRARSIYEPFEKELSPEDLAYVRSANAKHI
ncbi:cytochrome P450 [Dentipellis sp. KUC8613]|nr:cytochrome P450 [Dentipellis sp. KUC8613]